MNSKQHQSLLTTQVNSLLERMFKPSPIKDALIDGATTFFANQPLVEQIGHELDEKEQQVSDGKQGKTSVDVKGGNDKSKGNLERRQAQIEADKANFQQQMRSERIERHERLTKICYEILELTEGENFTETNRKSASVLGTIQLLSHTEGSQIARVNEQHKPLYKAILVLRLLDKLIIDEAIKDSYIQHFLGEIKGEDYKEFKSNDEEAYKVFESEVKVAVIKAALLQDIGNFHPDAQAILVGKEEDKDPYRTLDVEERKSLLQINYRETIRYLADGIGSADYMGNSKKDRDLFKHQEIRKLKFIKELLKGAINPQQGLGNLLKVPQIYTSIVLSTKTSYKYKLIPKVYQALYQNAERGTCSQKVVDALYAITGMFPQGFGVVYLALDAAGNSLERYEYAVVNQLYPSDPEEPRCRIATRQLTFIGYGSDMTINKSENLYFAESAKRLASMSRSRLEEILEKLVSNYQERIELDLIPRCWHPREFFSVRENQKLWNKS